MQCREGKSSSTLGTFLSETSCQFFFFTFYIKMIGIYLVPHNQCFSYNLIAMKTLYLRSEIGFYGVLKVSIFISICPYLFIYFIKISRLKPIEIVNHITLTFN